MTRDFKFAGPDWLIVECAEFLLAWGEVLTRWEGAETEQERDRALMWLGFLSQALLRKPVRGGRAGRREVAKRFECVNHGDWGNIVDMWSRDQRVRIQRGERRRHREN